MSRYYSKRNKAKVWRKTYGIPFVRRRALKFAQMAIVSAQGVAQIGSFGFIPGNPALSALAVAKSVIDTQKAIASIDFNQGFVTRGKQ